MAERGATRAWTEHGCFRHVDPVYCHASRGSKPLVKLSNLPAVVLTVTLLSVCALTASAQQTETNEPSSVTPPSPAKPSLECSEYVPPEERNDPKRLALRGVACFEAKDYLTALRHYRRARELSDANLLNAAIGRTFQELGYPFFARRYFRDYLGGQIDASQGRQRIKKRLDDVEKQLDEEAAEIELKSTPSGAEVYLVVRDTHRESIGRTPITVKMLPGEHRFVVEREGYIPEEHDVRVAKGGSRTVQSKLVDSDAAFSVSGRTLRRAGIVTMGAGTPLLATGAALWIVGRQKKSDAESLGQPARDEQIMRGSTLQQWGLVSGIVGVTALTTGFVLWWSGRHVGGDGAPTEDPQKPSSSVRITPIITFDSIGIGGRF